jgi:ribosomal protein L37AE/L43A
VPGIERQEREKVGDKGQVLTTLTMTFTFLDGDSGQELTRPWAGAGTDKEDKGLYKAMTGGEKYFLLKTFLMPTGDDPEKDDDKAPRGRQRQQETTSAPAEGATAQDDVPLRYEAEQADPRPRFREGKDLSCPNCKKRVFKRKDGSAWFCWQQKGGCGMQWANTTVDTATGEVSAPTVALADTADDVVERLRLLKIADDYGAALEMTHEHVGQVWKTYCGGANRKNVDIAALTDLVKYLRMRAKERGIVVPEYSEATV